MTREERENAIRCLKLWIEKEPYIQTYKTCLEALEQSMPTMVYPQVDGITPTVVAQADEEKVFKMRDATPEEQKSVDDYIKSISKPTGINFWDLDDNDDCISRKAVLSLLADHFDNVFDMVRKLPSVIIHNTTIQKSEQNNKKQEEQYEKIDCEKTDCKNCINHNDCDYEQLPSITISQEHDGCKDCKYEDYPEYYYPCCECKQNYVDEWQKKTALDSQK